MLERLARQLRSEAGAAGVDLRLLIYQDRKRENPIGKVEAAEELADFYWYASEHHGKRSYWRIADHVFTDARSCAFDHFFWLDDDLQLIDGFFYRAIRTWRAIVASDPRAATLNLILTEHREGRGIWGAGTPKRRSLEHQGERIEVWETDWTDCIFMAGPDIGHLIHEVQKISIHRWLGKPTLSSGVGAQITRRLRENEASQYQVTETLVHHGNHESKMNGQKPGHVKERMTTK